VIHDEGGPARAASIRERNERLILKLVFRDGKLSQSGAASRTGLKPPTVFRLFAELEKKGLIAPDAGLRGESVEKKGRRPLYYKVVPEAAYVLGFDLWAGSAAALLQDFSGRRVAFKSIAFSRPPDAEGALRAIEGLAAAILEEACVPSERLLGIGMGAPGSVSVDRGIVHYYSRIPGMRGFPLGERLEASFGAPVYVHNNASVVAMAEHRYGAARGARSLFSFLVRAGLGGAYLQDGNPITDRGRTAFEVGHLSVNMSGPPCACGSRGCLENILSEDAMLRAVGAATACANLEALDALIAARDPVAEQALAPALEAAAAAVRDIRRLLAPEAVMFVSRSAALSERLAEASAGPEAGDERFTPLGGTVLAAEYDPPLACRAACDLAYDAFFAGGAWGGKEER